MRKLILTIIFSIIITANFVPVSAQKKQEGKVPKMREVTIFVYQRVAQESARADAEIVPVQREIIDHNPLHAALKLLLKGTNSEEQLRGFDSFIFGLHLYSARVRNKTVEINFKFDNPEIALESWEGGGFDHDNFVKAVEQTAKQFPGVERVSICIDGLKNYLSYDQTKTGRCPFPMFPPPAPRRFAPNEMWEVKIFLNHEKEPPLPTGWRIFLPVKRRVKASDFLNETLRAFAAGVTDAERGQGWSSLTYGARFVSARLKKRKARVNFTMPKGERFPDEFAARNFLYAVKDTVLQFWNEIDQVEICLDGRINFDEENQKPIPCEGYRK